MRSFSKNIKPGFAAYSIVSSSLNAVDKTWTATKDGMMTIFTLCASATADTKVVIQDTTDSVIVCAISVGAGWTAANNLSATACFPVTRGHTYKTTTYLNVGVTFRAFFYPFA